MTALFRIVYAAHANGTHHKLALDGLRHMRRADADGWTRVFLKHVEPFLEGSKAPDNTFKDFKNHVLHVGDNYWGGAPEKVEEWYGATVAALRDQKWAEAAYAAGVLSHYYTDPIHPFHTGQTEAENAIHRACEWSINRSYNELRKLGEELYPDITVPSHTGERWLRETTCDGAEFSHRYYEKLIAHYDINRGVVEPVEGLDSVARRLVAELLMYAAKGFGSLMDRAIEEAGVTAPDVNLTIDTVLATLKIPAKALEKRLSNNADKALVRDMYDELKATGKVETNLPEDDRVIRDLHAAEVLSAKLSARAQSRSARVPAAPAVTAPQTATKSDNGLDRAIAKFANALESPTERAPTAQTPPAVPVSVPASAPVRAPVSAPVNAETRAAASTIIARPTPPPTPERETVSAAEQRPPAEPINLGEQRDLREAADQSGGRKRYLAMKDDLEAAPSIGPKMAEKFAGLGIMTVSDFLGHDPHDMAELLDDSRFDAETLADWQDQAKLVIDVPGLRGTGAQLLVGAGYRTCEALADADPVALSADVLTYATSTDGKRILREGNPPDLEKIKSWVEAAQEALAA